MGDAMPAAAELCFHEWKLREGPSAGKMQRLWGKTGTVLRARQKPAAGRPREAGVGLWNGKDVKFRAGNEWAQVLMQRVQGAHRKETSGGRDGKPALALDFQVELLSSQLHVGSPCFAWCGRT